jgi:hypothetical protein
MASKSVYQKYNTDALDHFGLETASYYGVVSSSGVDTVLFTDSETTYDKVKDLLKTNTLTGTSFKNKKKAFLLPKSPVSLDRVRAACKEHKITLTNDYELADVIITHDAFSQRFEHGETIKSTVMMGKFWNYHTAVDSGGPSKNFVDKYIETTGYEVLIDSKAEEDSIRRYNCSNGESLYDSWMITGMALDLAYKIDLGELDTIDVDTVVSESANKQELTEDLMRTLITQVSSYNEEDQSMAAMILPTIDYTKNHHLLWQFAQECGHKMYNFNRNKDVQYWLGASNFMKMHNMNAQSMIQWLEKEELLSSDNFRYLEPIVRKEITIYNRDLYVFKVEVKPEYRKYLKKVKQ